MKVLDIDGLNYYDGKIKQTYATKSYVDTQDALKAPLASPALTGNPTATTQTKTDNSTKLATTAFVKNNLNDYATLNGATFTGAVNGVTPTAGDDSTKLATTAYVQEELADYVTLNGLSTELGDYLPLAGGTMTGDINYFAPDIHSPDYSEHIAVGKCVTNRYGTKGTLPSSDYAPIYIPLVSARDTSDLSTTDAKCRYGIIEGVVYPDGGTNLSFRVYKNETDSTDNACLYMDYGITSGDEKQLVFDGKRIDVKAIGANYIRYGNGIQICWGSVSITTSENTGTNMYNIRGQKYLTFPVAFSSAPSVSTNVVESPMWWLAGSNSVTATALNIMLGGNIAATKTVYWTAIGKWN